jgi:hypothetical protein
MSMTREKILTCTPQDALGPVERDGTFVFSSPIGDGHTPLITLEDLGFFARYRIVHRNETPRRNLEIASEKVGWEHRRNVCQGARESTQKNKESDRKRVWT